MPLVFEWDPAKAEENHRKHGVAFDEAASAFADTLSITIFDPDHSETEERFVLVGLSAQNRFWSSYIRNGMTVFDLSARD